MCVAYASGTGVVLASLQPLLPQYQSDTCVEFYLVFGFELLINWFPYNLIRVLREV